MQRGGWTYVVTNKPRGVLYVGVTADLAGQIVQHKEGRGAAFCRRYNLTQLVHVEPHPTIEDAIAREKALKAWKRAWKIVLIESINPEWNDLFEQIA